MSQMSIYWSPGPLGWLYMVGCPPLDAGSSLDTVRLTVVMPGVLHGLKCSLDAEEAAGGCYT